MGTETMNKLLFTPAAAAEQLMISRATLYVLLQTGQLKAVKLGRSRRILASELERFVTELNESQGKR